MNLKSPRHNKYIFLRVNNITKFWVILVENKNSYVCVSKLFLNSLKSNSEISRLVFDKQYQAHAGIGMAFTLSVSFHWPTAAFPESLIPLTAGCWILPRNKWFPTEPVTHLNWQCLFGNKTKECFAFREISAVQKSFCFLYYYYSCH